MIYFYQLLEELLPQNTTECSVKKAMKKFLGINIPPICRWNPWFHKMISPAIRMQGWAAHKVAEWKKV